MLKEYLKSIDKVIEDGIYKDTWESLSNYEVGKWYKNAKFGLFSHYGVYNVPGYGSEWYSRNMYVKDSKTYIYHKKNYGNKGYKDLITDFKCESFDPNKWADIIKKSGAKYYIPVAEHHDGFAMYQTKLSAYNAMDMGPKKDIIRELKEAVNDVEFGVSSHRAEHFFFMSEGRKYDSDIKNPKYKDLYWPSIDEDMLGIDQKTTELFLQDWLVRCCELVDLFHPRIVYFDWWIEMNEFMPYLRKFLAYFYNQSLKFYNDPGVVNYKHDAVPYLVAVRDMERGQFSYVQHDYWQCCTSIATNSWSHTKNNIIKSSTEIIHVLIDVVSKNGNLLLNFCPHLNGTIVQEEINVLKEIGEWLLINGEGIYNTHPWKVYGEGDTNVLPGDFGEGNKLIYRQTDIRFTQRANFIYVFIMSPCQSKSFRIIEFGQRKRHLKWHNDIISICLLSDKNNNIKYVRNEDFMQVDLEYNLGNEPVCIRFEFL